VPRHITPYFDSGNTVTMKSVRILALGVIVSIAAALPIKSNGESILYGNTCLTY
jgi:hypothetical protein